MKIKMFQVDAFTDKLFGGNPAAVCVLDEWLSEELMQSIAAENNLAETAFLVDAGQNFEIRWFTPTVEVDLCGHATLAAAHVLFTYFDVPGHILSFSSLMSGILKVSRHGSLLTLNFPADEIALINTPDVLIKGLGAEPMETFMGKTDYMAVFPSQQYIVDLAPDFGILASLPECRGIIVTAEGFDTDFVSRFFAPQSGINEDPVTGSAHTTLIPYWAKTFDKDELTAAQLSQRKGHLQCRYLGDRVEISGHAVTYMKGEIEVGE